MNRISQSLVLFGIAVTAPVWAVSVPENTNTQPPESAAAPSSQYVATDMTTGSATLVPLMAVEMEANHAAAVDAPAEGGGGQSVDDLTFVRQATENSRKEIQSARDALLQLKNPELIRVAEMLVNDHSGANQRLSKIAEAKQWPLPAPQAPTAPPTGTASGNFDAKWTAEMIAGHERSVELYNAEAQSGEDKDLRKYARDTLPTIEHHLAELRRLQK
jgi:predicted outer membrane protein